MRRLLLLCWLLAAAGRAADGDMDGVDDALDRCPGTPFALTVSADGCPVDDAPSSLLIGVGSSYTTGTYGGTEPLDALSADLAVMFFSGNFLFSAMSGYYVFGAEDPTVAHSEEGGMGDTYLSAGYTFAPAEGLTLTPTAYVKLATAAETIGTGQNDFGASLLGIVRVGGSDLFAHYGYTVTGDGALTYRDISFGSAGITLHPAPHVALSLSYDVSQAYLAETPDIKSATLLGSYTLYDTLTLQAVYSYGLSDSAAEHALSIMLFKRF